MPSSLSAPLSLQHKLHELDPDERRHRRIQSRACGVETQSDGKALLAFSSNDYLGLANAPELVLAAQESLARWGLGAGSSPLVCGHTEVHEALEFALASFVGMEAALSFSTGYLANIAVMPALLGRGDAIFADRLNHASLVDGALLSRADLHRYGHLDLTQLADQLSRSKAKRKLIVTDSVFSMDGDIAPLADLLALAERHDAWLLVDDAHGFGLLGPQGRGALAEAQLNSPRIILMATLGKAAGVAGAFVAASQNVIDWLLQKARPYMFTTAPPPVLAGALLRSLQLIEGADARRAQLASLIDLLQTELKNTAWQLMPSRTAIQPILIGENDAALALSKKLEAKGFLVPAIRPPTVPPGTSRLRISLCAAHSIEHLQSLCQALREIEAAQR